MFTHQNALIAAFTVQDGAYLPHHLLSFGCRVGDNSRDAQLAD